MAEKKESKAFKILIITIVILLIGNMVFYYFGSEDLNEKLFTCNPYYFGNANSQPPYTCKNGFINATGNYCNGVLVCENERTIKGE